MLLKMGQTGVKPGIAINPTKYSINKSMHSNTQLYIYIVRDTPVVNVLPLKIV